MGVPDFVVRPEPDPLGDRSVLLGLLGQDPLDLEGFLGRLQTHRSTLAVHQVTQTGQKGKTAKQRNKTRPGRQRCTAPNVKGHKRRVVSVQRLSDGV